MTFQRIAVLTSGGDAPGMNAAIRCVVRVASMLGMETYGVHNGYRGLMDGDITQLGPRDVGGIITSGGTMLGSARAPEFRTVEGRDRARAALREREIEALVVIGGNGSQTGAHALLTEGLPVVGVASTIDNDIAEVDTTVGVDTALNTALEMIDRLRDTASSHHRAFVVETMGRNSGYLALMTGIASGAELILTPERPITVEFAIEQLRAAYLGHKRHFIVVAAEGSPLKAADLVQAINGAGGKYEARISVLGHVQRGGSPHVFDRLLATRSAAAAVHALAAGQTGVVAGIVKGRIDLVPHERAIKPTNKVSPELLDLAELLAH